METLVAEWARRMGFKATLLKEKSSKEDVLIKIGKDNLIVADAKSFRLGRSQKAPNVKDFLKLADIEKWMSAYDTPKGGLVTYPCQHEWQASSDVYRYCSNKNTPTIMLPYKYLAYLLKYKSNYKTEDLLLLWKDFASMFPKELLKTTSGGNKSAYWEKINNAILNITRTTNSEFNIFMNDADKLINECVQANIEYLEDIIKKIKANVIKETKLLKPNEAKAELSKYKELKETEELKKLMVNIIKFRL